MVLTISELFCKTGKKLGEREHELSCNWKTETMWIVECVY